MPQQTPRNNEPVGSTITISSRSMRIALGTVVVVAGAFMLGTRSRGPSGPSLPAAANLAAVPAPIMSQAAPPDSNIPRGNATAAAVAPFSGGARLAADNTRLDFGQKSFGETVDAQFTVTNVGDAPRHLESR